MLDGFINNINVDEHILNAIKEDITSEDVTTMAIMKEKQQGEVQLICKEDGILAGLSVFRRTFELLGNIEMQTSYKDGNEVKKERLLLV